MFDLLISPAWAETATAVPAQDVMGAFWSYLKFFLICGVFLYFMMYRPQKQRLDAQTAMLNGLKKGDHVVTNGGIVGTITKVEGDKYLVVEIANGVSVKIVRSTISGLENKEEEKKD